ncbi:MULTISPECIES: DUF2141 domain-containing protein [unclassified Ruegeria]|uniref:DUF2141 domain-containing protein n=1 Tax=unclassified Ruegeria TaxID=2625375 RepID=UPI001488A222|nr:MULTISPECIES: DUF2141 domain-containing protein [unclassified Ruegeria]NOD65813.1 DUF2141 domain-containing protein [Ruegeria sp. HKCCD6109]
MTRSLLALAFAIMTLATPTAADGLNVTVDGIRNAKGNVVILVFDNARAFDSLDVWGAVDYAQVPSRKGSVSHEFSNLNAGPYAVLLFHDENKDEDLNMTATKLLEGVGSTGAPNPEDEPDFKAASVWPGDVRVRIHYDQ